MKRIISKFFRRIAELATIGVCIPYLSTVLLPYIDTGRYWYLSIIGLGFPVLFFLLLFSFVFWLIMRSWIAIACIVVMLAGFQQIRATFGFNLPEHFELKKDAGALRVFQWNVHNWNMIRFENERNFDMNSWPKMMDVIRKYNADVLCLEEFYESEDRKKYPSTIAILKEMGYKYFYFLNNGLLDNVYYAGIAIFSKYPIKESGEVRVADKTNTDPLAYADIDINGKRIRVVAIHLQSVEFGKQQYQNISKLRKAQKPDAGEGRTIISKLKKGFRHRYSQAVSVNRQIEESPFPVLVCGDFNDVPTSGTYYTITKNLQDAFLKKGTFIGRTFRFISPTLRIDYILPGKNFEVLRFKRIQVPYSDHFPLVADMRY